MPLHRSLCLLFMLIALALPGVTARADAPADAAKFVGDMINQALDVLRDSQISTQDRNQRFTALLTADFDIPRISRFVLGRYWITASDAEREEFGRLFQRWVVRTYSARLDEYAGETVKVVGTKPQSETDIVVETEVIHPSGAPPAKLDWLVRHKDDSFKVVDVDVEGVSMALTEKEEFASVIQRNGGTVADLNKALQDKLASGDGGSQTR